jgi:hypothetical protein
MKNLPTGTRVEYTMAPGNGKVEKRKSPGRPLSEEYLEKKKERPSGQDQQKENK